MFLGENWSIYFCLFFSMLCFLAELLNLKPLLLRFLVGEGAHAWAKSKGIVSDESKAAVDEVGPLVSADNLPSINPFAYKILSYNLKYASDVISNAVNCLVVI